MNVIKDTGQRAILPPFSEEHEQLRETVRRFVQKEIAPHVEEWEAAREFPQAIRHKYAEMATNAEAAKQFTTRPPGASPTASTRSATTSCST